MRWREVERIDAVVEALLEPRAREQRGVCWREAHDGAEEEGEEAMAEHCVCWWSACAHALSQSLSRSRWATRGGGLPRPLRFGR